MNFQVLDKDGRPITSTNEAVPDGAIVRVPQLLMDGTAQLPQLVIDAAPSAGLHRPGSLPLTDADRDAREAALADRDRRLSEAWKHPAPAQLPADAKPPQTAPAAPVAGVSDADARYADRCAALERAYRGA